jgi:hypothetical protein
LSEGAAHRVIRTATVLLASRPSHYRVGMRSLHRALFVVPLLVLVACPPPVVDGGPEPDAWPLDTLLGAGEVRCGAVTRPSELIGGPLAFGVVGHSFRCHNSRIRFLVQDGERAFGTSVRGGNLIDIDLVRGDESAPGADAFREHVVAWGARESIVESIVVIDDGRSGQQGVIRVRGRPGPLTLAPQAALLAQDMPVMMETDYILRPDVDTIEVRTRLINESDDQLYNIMMLDFVSLGGVNRHMNTVTGLGDTPLFTEVPFLMSGGSDVSYGFLCGEGRDMNIYFGEVGIYGPSCGDDIIVTTEAEASRTIIVGDGTFESVARRIYEIRGDVVGHVTGTVRESASSLADVEVWALKGDPLDTNARAVNGTRSDAQGRFALTLPPGSYEIVALERNSRRSTPIGPVEVTAGEDIDVVLGLRPSGTVRVVTTFVDANGAPLQPLPAKVTLVDGTYKPSAALGEVRVRGTSVTVPDADGTVDIEIEPGSYRVFVSRGFEFTVHEELVTVGENGVVDVDATLTHVVDTTGLIGGEFHQHTLGSSDADVPIPVKVLENAAEGVEFAAATEHDNIVDFTPWVEELGLAEHLVCVPGNEVSYQSIGHFNVYPWQVDPADPTKDVGTRLWWMKTLPDLFSDLRRRAGETIVQINHPRSSNTGAFASMRLNPVDATRAPRPTPTLETLPPDVYEQWTSDFDAIEVNADVGTATNYTDDGYAALGALVSSSPSQIPVLADYFALLGAGLAVTAMGNSDTHHEGEGVGWPRNFMRLDTDVPTAVTKEAVVAAIRGQRVSVGNGCLIELFVGDARPMGMGEALTSTPTEVRVRLQAPAWVEMSTFEIYVNGRVRALVDDGDGGLALASAGEIATSLTGRAVDETVRLDVPVRAWPSGDLVVLALARGGSLSPVGGGQALCYSAPLYVDDGGDGFTGWLSASETISSAP